MMTRINNVSRRFLAIIAAWTFFAACSAQSTLSTTGNSFEDGGTAEGMNGNAVIGELGSSGGSFSAGSFQMTVVIGQSIGMDAMEEGDLTISNSLGAAKYLAGIDE